VDSTSGFRPGFQTGSRCAAKLPIGSSSPDSRSAAARDAFKRTHPCPSTGKTSGPCPGYVIDHIQALKHGGADFPSNMQWQTKSAAKAKDKWE